MSTASNSRSISPASIGQGINRDLMNLQVLQRIDPLITEVLTTSRHVVAYVYSLGSGAWEKRNIEGSLFLIRRQRPPEFQMFLMNRQSTENMIDPVAVGTVFDYKEPYLMYKNSVGEITGLWFHSDEERLLMWNLLQRIISGNAPRSTPHPNTTSLSQQNPSAVCQGQVPQLHQSQSAHSYTTHVSSNSINNNAPFVSPSTVVGNEFGAAFASLATSSTSGEMLNKQEFIDVLSRLVADPTVTNSLYEQYAKAVMASVTGWQRYR